MVGLWTFLWSVLLACQPNQVRGRGDPFLSCLGLACLVLSCLACPILLVLRQGHNTAHCCTGVPALGHARGSGFMSGKEVSSLRHATAQKPQSGDCCDLDPPLLLLYHSINCPVQVRGARSIKYARRLTLMCAKTLSCANCAASAPLCPSNTPSASVSCAGGPSVM